MFLTTGALETRFEERLAGADRVDIATAWATCGPVLEMLCKAAKKKRVKVRAIVGTYGNATHPDALERLRDIGELRLVAGNRTMFHPKVYIFRATKGNCAWIGSANFTGAGFARNEEAVHETEDVAGAVEWFRRRWTKCGPLDPGAIEAYRTRRRKQGVSRSLAGLVGRSESGTGDRLAYLREANSWKQYVRALKKCEESWLDEGYGWSVLKKTCSYVHTIEEGKEIARRTSWIGITDEERTILLGLRDDVNGTWGLLGSLGGAGKVNGIFNRSTIAANGVILGRVRDAVDVVISARDRDFPDVAVKALEQIDGEKRFSYGTATRLLALARPDKLVSVNKGSRYGLARVFGVSKDSGKGLDLSPTTLGEPENYRLLLERLYAAPWYRGPPGRSKRERQLWNMRAALVDSFVYVPDSKA